MKELKELITKCLYNKAKLEIGMLVFMEKGNLENPEKNPQSKDKNQQ